MPPDAPGGTARVAAAVVARAGRWPWLILFFCAATVAAGVWLSMNRLQYHTQRNDLIGKDKDCQKRWQKYLDAFGDDDDLVVVVKGSDRTQMTAAAEVVAAKLAARPELFDRVFHRVDLRPLQSRSLLYLPADDLRTIDRKLDGMSPLLGPLAVVGWHGLSLDSLLTQGAAVAEAQTAQRPLSAADRDLLAQLPAVVESATGSLQNSYRNPWRLAAMPSGDEKQLTEPQYFFTPDGALALVLARPKKKDGNESFAPAKDACDAARAIVAAVRTDFPRLTVGLTGLPVLESDEMTASDEDSDNASWLALAGVAVLYFVVYRGFRYPLLTVGTLLVGTFWALGWATLTVGHLNILSATFAVMIIGMGDYGVLWIARYDEERRGGRTIDAAMHATAIHAGPGILTAAATAALAFFVTMFADFQAVAELGWIAGSGVLFCALACFTILPALLTLSERRAKAPHDQVRSILPFPAAARPFLPGLSARPRLVLALGGLLIAGGALFAGRVGYDSNLLHMQAAGLDSVTWENELITHAAGATWDAMSLAESREDALAMKAKYETLPGVGRVIEAASLLPGDQEAKLPILASIHGKLSRLPATVNEPPLPSPARIVEAATRLHATIDTSALRTTLTRATAEQIRTFDRQLCSDLLNDLQHLAAVSEPTPILASDLPAAFRERYIGRNGVFLVRAFASESLWEFPALERFTQATQAVDPEATGKSFRTLEGLRQMKAGFEKAGLLALGVIVAVLWLDFRKLPGVLLGLFPLAVGVVATLGLMGLCGVSLNPANLIALPLIVGVGVDNGVHVLHDYAERRAGTLYKLGTATGRGILVSALTTVLGFGTLMTARHRGMASLGLALTVGVSCCMGAALVLLPAVLRLLDRRRMKQPAKGERNLHRAA